MMRFSVSYHEADAVGNIAVEIEIKRHNFFSEAAAQEYVRAIKEFVKALNAKDGQ